MVTIVSIVELGANDKCQVNGICHDLFFHSEMMANKISSPDKWDTGGFATILLDMEKGYTKVDEELKGSWFSVFVELEARGKQMLLTTPTVWKVRHCVN